MIDTKGTGMRIRQILKSHKLTSRAVAEHLNLSLNTVKSWRTGTSMPSIDTLLRLSKLTGKHMEDFLVEMEEKAEMKAMRK
jgi:transcriptional regulator with XRE-family HTH domain